MADAAYSSLDGSLSLRSPAQRLDSVWKSHINRKNVAVFVGGCVLGALLVLSVVLVMVAYRSQAQPSADWVQPTEPFIDMIRSVVSPKAIEANVKLWASKPHMAGTANSRAVAANALAQLQSFGLNAWLEDYNVLVTFPVRTHVALVAPTTFTCSLTESNFADGTANTSAVLEAVMPWNGWSASGNVTAPLAYVNYGRAEDFELIKDVNLTGTIVIVRYGQIFRGNKCALAAERGAVGCIIFTDFQTRGPPDTIYPPLNGIYEPVYPQSPWAGNTTVQRGSVWIGNGDPTTPGWPALPGAPTFSNAAAWDPDLTDGNPLPSIPIQPMSYGDALPLLRALGGAAIPSPDWEAGLDITNIGPGPAIVNMDIAVTYVKETISNVIARVDGDVEPDRLVMVGAHHDAWTFGACDDTAGAAVLVEMARVVAHLVKRGWKPRRTVLMALWDMEEAGLVGSMEFVDNHYTALLHNAVAYLNLDGPVSGMDLFAVSASPSFRSLVGEVAAAVAVPKTHNPSKATVLSDMWDGVVSIPGAGSDNGPFLTRAGVAVMYPGLYGSPDLYEPSYHSNSDSFYLMSAFIDPGFEWHGTFVEFYVTVLVRLAGDAILPMSPADYASALVNYTNDLVDVLKIVDPQQSVNMSLMLTGAQHFSEVAQAATAELARLSSKRGETSSLAQAFAQRRLNDVLMDIEKSFLSESPDLSGSQFDHHVLFSPSRVNSYAGVAFPAIYDIIESGNMTATQLLVGRIGLLIHAAAETMGSTMPGSIVPELFPKKK